MSPDISKSPCCRWSVRLSFAILLKLACFSPLHDHLTFSGWTFASLAETKGMAQCAPRSVQVSCSSNLNALYFVPESWPDLGIRFQAKFTTRRGWCSGRRANNTQVGQVFATAFGKLSRIRRAKERKTPFELSITQASTLIKYIGMS